MKILIINSWSSSLKFQVFEDTQVLAVWQIERIWHEDAIISYQRTWENKNKSTKSIKNHHEALNTVLENITNTNIWVLESIQDLDVVWHRVVHWWEYFQKPTIITDDVIAKIEELSALAPLHNPANLMGIQVCKELLWIPQVAVFDTSFHQTLLPESYLYSLPKKYYKKYKLRRYWFHWISHQYIWESISDILENKDAKVISCHVGNGASVAAIEWWKVIATSMWFTPLEWLTMGTRSWDIDPGALLFLMEKENLSPKDMTNLLNKESGVLWLTWYSWDLRDIEDGHIAQQEVETLVMNIYINQIVKYIGAYYTLMWWCDAIVFTAGVMENSPYMRALVADKLECLWIQYDKDINNCRGKKVCISTANSKIPLRVIPTNEEWLIARETKKLLS